MANKPHLNKSECESPVGLIWNRITGVRYVKGCGKWKCWPCGRRKAKQVYRKHATIQFGWFLTFTAPAAVNPTRASVMEINKAWKHFRQWLSRSTRTSAISYLWANEAGEKSSQLHKHVLLTGPAWFDWKQARSAVQRINGFGVVCDFRQLVYGPTPRHPKKGRMYFKNPGEGVGYLVNYLTSDSSIFPKYSRRIQSSVREKREKSEGWHFTSLPACNRPEKMREIMTACGVMDHGQGKPEGSRLGERQAIVEWHDALRDLSLFWSRLPGTLFINSAAWRLPGLSPILALRMEEKLLHDKMEKPPDG